MKNHLKSSIYIICMFLFVLTSCKKEFTNNKINDKLKSGNVNFMEIPQYNSTYDVLMFNSFNDFHVFIDKLEEYQNNFPYDRGNTAIILQKINQIRIHGFTNGNGNNNGNKVKIKDFEDLLFESSPLSDTVLLGLIKLNDDLNPPLRPPFMRDVFVHNVPFSYSVEQKLINANIPNGIKNQILEANDNQVMIPNFAIDEFLALHPNFKSLFKKIENQESLDLLAGMDPSDPNFANNHFVEDEIIRSVLNDKLEVYIENNLIKLYSDCKSVWMNSQISDAYQSLNLLNNDGFIATPNIAEPQTGIPVENMNSVFPMNYAVVGDIHYENFNGNSVPIKLENLNSFNVLMNCPQSSFTSEFAELSAGYHMQFTSIEVGGFDYSEYYQFWTFGDGTGSFQSNPLHVYASPGTYSVTLTTFNQDCGCWDVRRKDVVVPSFEIGEPSFSCTSNNINYSLVNGSPETGTWQFSIDAFAISDPSVVPVSIEWYFGDEIPYAPGNYNPTISGDYDTYKTVQHTYTQVGEYDVECKVTFSNGCYTYGSIEAFYVNAVECCNVKKISENPAEQKEIGGKTYKMCMFDNVLPKGAFLKAPQVNTKLVLYRKIAGIWIRQKADAIQVRVQGNYYQLSSTQLWACTNQQTLPYKEGGGYSENSAKAKSKPNETLGFGTKDDEISIYHYVKIGSVTWSKTNKYGDCK